MTAANLKMDLIHKIIGIKEHRVIEEINRLIDFELDEGVFRFTEDQKIRISEAETEYKNGKVLSESDANKQIEEWLHSK